MFENESFIMDLTANGKSSVYRIRDSKYIDNVTILVEGSVPKPIKSFYDVKTGLYIGYDDTNIETFMSKVTLDLKDADYAVVRGVPTFNELVIRYMKFTSTQKNIGYESRLIVVVSKTGKPVHAISVSGNSLYSCSLKP